MNHSAYPHALHPESMDRHAGITLTPNKIILIYQVICGLNPTERYSKQLDPDNDDTITDEERSAFVNQIAHSYIPKQVFQINSRDIGLTFHSGDAYASVGHNGMHVIKVDIAYTANYPASIPRNSTVSFVYEDRNFDEVPGWKQMQVSTRDGVVYEGYIPYSEYQPFDYEIIATKGFTPSTEKIMGTVNIPEVESQIDAEVSLPEKVEVSAGPKFESDVFLVRIVFGLAGLFAVIAVLLGYRAFQR